MYPSCINFEPPRKDSLPIEESMKNFTTQELKRWRCLPPVRGGLSPVLMKSGKREGLQ